MWTQLALNTVFPSAVYLGMYIVAVVPLMMIERHRIIIHSHVVIAAQTRQSNTLYVCVYVCACVCVCLYISHTSRI